VLSSVTGLILAGGKGSRMGGVDKGLQAFRGKRLVDHVYERLAPQVGGIIINANQNQEEYRTFGVRVVSDAITGFAGPLAGFHAGLSVSKGAAGVIAYDSHSPRTSSSLYAQLKPKPAGVAKTGEQPHPVFSLMRRGVLDHLAEFLKGGGRKIDAWYATLNVVEVAFDNEPEAFSNMNTLEELQTWEGAPRE
jgi:molybdopterin-guanine dinucleotide biosynthesis protein A